MPTSYKERDKVGIHAQICAFVVRFQDSIIPLISVVKISSLQLVSVAEQASLPAQPPPPPQL